VKPGPFDYVAAGSVEEAVSTLAEADGEAKVLAGGQSLLPLLNMRLARPSVLVDVNPIPGLDRIDVDGRVRIGALVRQADALASEELRAAAPLFAVALRHVGHATTRSRGTIGGAVAHGDPAAELPAALLALDGEVVVNGPSGVRTIAAADLVLGPFTTSLAADELLTTVVLPRQAARGFGFAEVCRRHGDFALAGAAVVLDPARVVLFGLGGAPVRAEGAERALDAGAGAAEAAGLATVGLDAVTDVHADGAYRLRVASVLVRRAIEEARGA
jgi:CO/xanthine dehydrogenase FAD-binding subunit